MDSAEDVQPPRPEEPADSNLHGPYLNAPMWPWVTAGCLLGVLLVLLFVLAYRYA